MKEFRLIYIASPYSHKSSRIETKRFQEITKIASILQTRNPGMAMFLPITQSHMMRVHGDGKLGTSFDAWKDVDLNAINHCDEVWVIMMNGWLESKGVTAEIEHALLNNKMVRYFTANTLEEIYA